MRWPKLRRAAGPDETDPREPTPAEPVAALARDETITAGTATEIEESDPHGPRTGGRGGIRWSQLAGYAVLPGLALLLAVTAGFLKWQEASVGDSGVARAQSVRVATESTVAMLSYRPDTVRTDLEAAQDRLTGTFRDAYTSLIHDVVIPGSQEKQISAVATVPAAASTSATPKRATVLVFVNQSIVIGEDAPTSTVSNVLVTLDKVDGRWLISGFDPL